MRIIAAAIFLAASYWLPCRAQGAEDPMSRRINDLVTDLTKEDLSGGPATRELISIGKPAADALLRLLEKGSKEEKAHAAVVLGHIADASVFVRLWELFEKGDENVRASVICALCNTGRSNGEATMPVLKRGLGDGSPMVRSTSTDAVVCWLEATRDAERRLLDLTPMVARNLLHDDAAVREDAVVCLQKFEELPEPALVVVKEIAFGPKDEAALSATEVIACVVKGDPRTKLLSEIAAKGASEKAKERARGLVAESQRPATPPKEQ
jgi:HEAT repeat protein